MTQCEVWIGKDAELPFVGMAVGGKERRVYAPEWDRLPQDWLLCLMMGGRQRRFVAVYDDVMKAFEN